MTWEKELAGVGYRNSRPNTKSLLFKPSVMQPISQTTYDLNSALSSHVLNNEPFKEQIVLDHSNNKLVHYSDPHCMWQIGRLFWYLED